MTKKYIVRQAHEELARAAAAELEAEIQRRVDAGEDLEDLEVVVKEGRSVVEKKRPRR